MIKSISKFQYEEYRGDYPCFAFNQQKYTKEQSIEIWKQEVWFDDYKPEPIISESFVTWRAGVTEDYEPRVGWWLSDTQYRKSVKVWKLSYEVEA